MIACSSKTRDSRGLWGVGRIGKIRDRKLGKICHLSFVPRHSANDQGQMTNDEGDVNHMKRIVTSASVVVALALALLPLGCSRSGADPSKHSQESQGDLAPVKESERRIGLQVNDPRAFQGYTLVLPMMSGKSYLVDMQGKVVRQWESESYPALSAYLLENGHLLRTGTLAIAKLPFGGPG